MRMIRWQEAVVPALGVVIHLVLGSAVGGLLLFTVLAKLSAPTWARAFGLAALLVAALLAVAGTLDLLGFFGSE